MSKESEEVPKASIAKTEFAFGKAIPQGDQKS